MRQSFLLHIDSLCVLDELTNEQRGELFYAIYKYQLGEDFELSPIVKIAFSQFKNQFKRDDEKYKKVCEARKQAGAMGGKQRVANQANATKCKQNKANQADSDNKSDSDSVNDSDIKELLSCNKCKDIISYLNAKADTNYKATSSKTASLINARLKEGFTLEDFKSVIDDKVHEWGSDHKMSKYLRPETLFGTKFEGYLNTISKDVEPTSTIYFDEDNYKPYGVFEETA